MFVIIVVICPPPCVSNICLFSNMLFVFRTSLSACFFLNMLLFPLMFPHVHGSHIFLDFFPSDSYCDVDFLAPKWAQGQRRRALQRLPSQVYSGSAGSNWNCGLEGLKRMELLKDGASSIFCWLAGDFPFKQLKGFL